MVLICAGAIILDPGGRVFVQRRAPDRRLFPDCWDIVGGHAEAGETPEQTLRREVHEETGWRVARILDRLPPIGWLGNDGYERIEHDFVVTVEGDLAAPRLETDKHTAAQWITEDRLDLLTDNRFADEYLVRWAEALAAGTRRLVGTDFAGVVAAEVERVFPATMRAMAGLGGRELVERYGRPAVGPLIEFRTSLAWPGRWVTASQVAAVGRYRDPADLATALAEAARAGSVELDGQGAVRATDLGHRILADLHAQQDRATARLWAGHEGLVARLADRMAPVLAAADRDGGDAWRAMAPAYEPDDAGPGLRLLTRLGTIRYHRADAHAAAWHTAGLTAAETAALPPGPVRDTIEADTNRRASTPYAGLAPPSGPTSATISGHYPPDLRSPGPPRRQGGRRLRRDILRSSGRCRRGEQRVLNVVILAAGLGTRLGRPYPKPLTPLSDGRSILRQQLDHLRTTFAGTARVTVVVGFKMDLIMEAAADDASFVYNEVYDQTNTNKSLLKALRLAPPGGVLWLNGDVVFVPGLLDALRPLIEADRSFVAVNTASVADEEVKYTLDADGYVKELSKQVVGGLGEAIGINYVSGTDRETLVRHLEKCADLDYFERGIETAIAEDGMRVAAVDIGRFGCVEVDFEPDLVRANELQDSAR